MIKIISVSNKLAVRLVAGAFRAFREAGFVFMAVIHEIGTMQLLGP